MSLRLVACQQALTTLINKQEIAHLRRLSYTDLGDMEDDPMVKKIEHPIDGHHHVDK